MSPSPSGHLRGGLFSRLPDIWNSFTTSSSHFCSLDKDREQDLLPRPATSAPVSPRSLGRQCSHSADTSASWLRARDSESCHCALALNMPFQPLQSPVAFRSCHPYPADDIRRHPLAERNCRQGSVQGHARGPSRVYAHFRVDEEEMCEDARVGTGNAVSNGR